MEEILRHQFGFKSFAGLNIREANRIIREAKANKGTKIITSAPVRGNEIVKRRKYDPDPFKRNIFTANKYVYARNKKKEIMEKRKMRQSKYMIMIDTKLRPDGVYTGQQLKDVLDDYMKYFTENVKSFITFNEEERREDLLNNIEIKYAVENLVPVYKRRTAKGTWDKRGGTTHLHGTVNIRHYSNISMNKDNIQKNATAYLQSALGQSPYVGRVQFVGSDTTEEYDTKDDEYQDKGFHWEDRTPDSLNSKKKRRFKGIYHSDANYGDYYNDGYGSSSDEEKKKRKYKKRFLLCKLCSKPCTVCVCK